MADTYRYPLTRICLRTGSLTLPLNLLGVFPERGDVVAVDPQKDAEFALHVEGRRILGMGPFFAAHELTVNDELTIRPLEDGRYAFTAVARPRRPDVTRPEFIGRLLDSVVEAGVPVSEDEIRGLHPEIPAGFPLRQALEREPRLTQREGRWQRRLPETREEAPAAGAATGDRPARASDRRERESPAADRREAERLRLERRDAERAAAQRAQAEQEAAEREWAERAQAEALRAERQEAERARAEIDAANTAQAEREAEILRMVQEEELERVVGTVLGREGGSSAPIGGSGDEPGDDAGLDDLDLARQRSRERLASHAEDDVQASARRQRDARAERRRSESGESDDSESFGWDQPLIRRLRLPWIRRREEPKESVPEATAPVEDPLKLDRLGEPRPVDRNAPPAPRVSPAPRAALFATDAGLNSATLPPGDPAATKRAREAFTALGYRVEGLAHGQLMLHADYGRRFERILVHVLPDGQRLEWAALLARRREAAATHLAVAGDHRDLHRLVAPADYAKATLWSWAGLDRVLELAEAMPISPADLDPHFEHDGLFDYGLERFERTIAKRVQERGALSAVLERLAQMKAPTVFMIEDLVGGADLSREQALRVLERLCEAPWHLVQRVDTGEFCLRYRVHDALDQIGTYTASLRARLPERQRELVRGLADGLDPIDAADVVGDGGAAAGSSAAPGEAPSAEPDGPAAQRAPKVHAATAPDAPEPVPVPAARTTASSQPRLVPERPPERARPFAGPGLGEDDPDPDEVDVSLVAVKRRGRRR